MATQTHGYYGLGGYSKSADFGLAANMTLPIITPVDTELEVAYGAGSSATMPTEGRKEKKKARFAVDTAPQEEEQQEVVLRNPGKVGRKPSWRVRISSLFRRNSKLEKRAEAMDNIADLAGPANDALAPPQKTVDDLEVIKVRKKKNRKKRDAKSRSTAFDDPRSMPYSLQDDLIQSSSDFLKLALRPKTAGTDFEAIRVTLRRQADGFGIHLSGGLPPISVTYVQPGSEAESARIVVGDIVTEVNGHDCRKGVGISRIMELKSLIQQSSVEQEEGNVDDVAWEKIKEKQKQIESDNSEDGEITRIDDSTESEGEQPVLKAEPPPKVETPEPAIVSPKSSTPKKSGKKKKKRTVDPTTAVSPIKPPHTSEHETSHTSPIKDLSSVGNDSPSMVTVGIIKKQKRKKKASSTHESRTMETDEQTSLAERTTEPSLVETSANASSMTEEPTKEPVKKAKKKRRPKEQSAPSSEMADTRAPAVTNESIDRSLEEAAAAKTANDSAQKPEKDPEARKKRAAKGKGKAKKKRSKPTETTQGDGERKKRLTPSNSGSKVKAALEESDDLEWVDYGQQGSNGLERRKSVDTGAMSNNMDELNPAITSEKRSTSYHDLDKEDRKMFREELRQASKSEYDIKDQVEGRPKVEIDPNVRVKKSGKVIGKRKTSDRPSIWTDGGEVEKEDDTEGKKGSRKLVMDMDFSAIPETSPSLGLKHGHEKLDVVSRGLSKRRPASFRKSLLLDSNKEVLMGDERVNLADKAEGRPLARQTSIEKPPAATLTKPTTPTDDINQPKPRPRKQSIVEYMESLQKTKYKDSLTRPVKSSPMDTQNELPTTIAESSDMSPSAAFAAAVQKKEAGSGRALSTEDRLKAFEMPRSGRSKTVEQPVKKLGIASEPAREFTQSTPPATSESPKNVPAWVAIAQNKRNRTSVMYDSKPAEPNQPAKTSPPKADPALPNKRGRQDESVPKMGTVQDRLAMFQKFK